MADSKLNSSSLLYREGGGRKKKKKKVIAHFIKAFSIRFKLYLSAAWCKRMMSIWTWVAQRCEIESGVVIGKEEKKEKKRDGWYGDYVEPQTTQTFGGENLNELNLQFVLSPLWGEKTRHCLLTGKKNSEGFSYIHTRTLAEVPLTIAVRLFLSPWQLWSLLFDYPATRSKYHFLPDTQLATLRWWIECAGSQSRLVKEK